MLRWEIWGKVSSCGDSQSKALERFLCQPFLQRAQEDKPVPDLLSSCSESLSWGLMGLGNSNHGTKLPARWRSLPGSSSIYGISSVGFTVGTKMLGLQVQVKLLNASPLIIMLLWMCLFLFKWYSWSHLVMTTSKPQHTVHKPPTAMSPSLSSPTSEI